MFQNSTVLDNDKYLRCPFLRRLGFVIFHLKRDCRCVKTFTIVKRNWFYSSTEDEKRFLQPHCKIKKKYDLCVHDVVVSVKDHDKQCT